MWHLKVASRNANTIGTLIQKVNIRGWALTLSTNRHQFDSLAADEVQGFIHVCDFVETHLAFVGFGQPLA